MAAAFATILATVTAQVAITAASGSGTETTYLRGQPPASQPTSFPMPPPERVQKRVPLSEKQIEMLELEDDLQDCAEKGNWEQALTVLEDLNSRGLDRTTRAWTFAATACAMQGQWEQAVALLTSMENATVKPNHKTFHSVLEACEQDFMGAHHQVNELMMGLRRNGLLPQLVHYVKAIGILAKVQQFEKATEYYEEASQLGLFDVWVDRGRSLDVRELPTEVAEVVLRAELEKRAVWNAGGKAGKGGFYVLTGSSAKATAFKQRALVRIMKEEYGLKVRIEPAKFGRFLVKNDELVRAGREIDPGARPQGSAKGSRRSARREHWRNKMYS